MLGGGEVCIDIQTLQRGSLARVNVSAPPSTHFGYIVGDGDSIRAYDSFAPFLSGQVSNIQGKYNSEIH